jgi:hypothetical protein
MVHGLIEAARMSGVMAWEILWALCLGFLLSSVVEAVVSKAQMSRLLPDSSAKTIVKASALGAALLVRFLKTGGPAMLREMGNAPADSNAEPHSCCHEEPVAAGAMHDCCHEEPVAAVVAHDCCHGEPEPVAAHDCCQAEPAAAVADCCHVEPAPKGDCH